MVTFSSQLYDLFAKHKFVWQTVLKKLTCTDSIYFGVQWIDKSSIMLSDDIQIKSHPAFQQLHLDKTKFHN